MAKRPAPPKALKESQRLRGRKGWGTVYTAANGNLYASFDFGMVNGKRNRERLPFVSKNAAYQWLAEQRDKKAKGDAPLDADSTLGEMIKEYLGVMAADDEGSQGTQRQRAWLLGSYVVKHKNSVLPLGKIEMKHINEILKSPKGIISDVSIMHLRSWLRAAFHWAMAEGYVRLNPVSLTKAVKYKERPATFLSRDLCERLLTTAATTAPDPKKKGEKDLRDFALWFQLELSLGLRFGELAGLGWDQLQGNMLKITRQAVAVSKGTGFSYKKPDDPKVYRASWDLEEPKWASMRDITLPASLLADFEAHRQRQNERLPKLRREAGRAWLGDDPRLKLVFPSDHGTPITNASYLKRVWAPLMDTAGIPRRGNHTLTCMNVSSGRTDHRDCAFVKPHDLRHTGLSLLQDTMTTKATMAVSGHLSANTLARYTHPTETQQALSLAAIERISSIGRDVPTHVSEVSNGAAKAPVKRASNGAVGKSRAKKKRAA